MPSLSRRGFLALAALFLRAPRLQAAAVTLDEFIELSERLLGRRGLDRKAGQMYLDVISADPDNAVTLAYLVQSNGNPTPEQRALSAMIVALWNTGGAVAWTWLGLSAPWFRGW